MEPKPKPEVKLRKSGVHYVEAEDILNSEIGIREVRKAAAHAGMIRRNLARLEALRAASA